MSHTITLTEHIKTIGTDTVQTEFVFTNTGAGSDVSYTFEDKDILVTDHGEIEWAYDLEDTLLAPASLSMRLSDKAGYISGLLFDNSNIEPRFKVKIKINGVYDFIGTVLEDGFEYDVGEREIVLEASPQMEALASSALFGDNDELFDPLEYSWGTPRVISAATHSGGTVTITHVSDSSFNVGATVYIYNNLGMTDINGYHIITAENSSTEFEIDLYTEQTLVAGGYCVVIGDTGVYKNIPTLLRDLYRLVDDSIETTDIDIKHNWDFNCSTQMSKYNITNAVHAAGTVTVTHVARPVGYTFGAGDKVMIEDVVGMTDLNGEFTVASYVDVNNFTVSLTTAQTYTSGGTAAEVTHEDFEDISILTTGIFNEPDNGITNCADLLKQLALDFFSFTGMIHEQKPFFRKLFYYDNTDLQTVENILSHKYKYKLPLIEYVKIKTTGGSNERVWIEGNYSTLEEKRLTREICTVMMWYDWGVGGGSNLQEAGGDAAWLAIDSDVDDSYNAWKSAGELLSQLWYDNRSDLTKCRIEFFEVPGLSYNFLKNFNYNGDKYQIMRLRKRIGQATSEIDALNLGTIYANPFI